MSPEQVRESIEDILFRIRNENTCPKVVAEWALRKGRTADEAFAWVDANVNPDFSYDWEPFVTDHPESLGSRGDFCCTEILDGWEYCPICGDEVDRAPMPTDEAIKQAEAEERRTYIAKCKHAVRAAAVKQEVAA